MKKSALLVWLILLFSFPLSLFAQTKTITGKVVNGNGDPVPLATIQQKGTKKATTSDDMGAFTITVTGKNPVLMISSVSYQQQQVDAGNETALVRGKVDRQHRDLFRSADSAHRLPRRELLADVRDGPPLARGKRLYTRLERRRFNRPGADRIAADPGANVIGGD